MPVHFVQTLLYTTHIYVKSCYI